MSYYASLRIIQDISRLWEQCHQMFLSWNDNLHSTVVESSRSPTSQRYNIKEFFALLSTDPRLLFTSLHQDTIFQQQLLVVKPVELFLKQPNRSSWFAKTSGDEV